MLKRFLTMGLILCSACPGNGPNTSTPRPIECASHEFHAVDLQTAMRPSVLRIEGKVADGIVTGTGFVIRNDENGLLIATNNHVIREGNSFDAILDGGMRIAQLVVVKVDAERDLALLKAPPLGGQHRIIVLASSSERSTRSSSAILAAARASRSCLTVERVVPASLCHSPTQEAVFARSDPTLPLDLPRCSIRSTVH